MPGSKPVTLHSKAVKSLALFFVVIFVWQSLAEGTFASAITPPANKYQSHKEYSIHNDPAPAPRASAATYLKQGLRHYDLGRWREAIVSFEEAISIRPDYDVAHFSLGIVYSRVGRWKEALASFKKAVEISPNYAEGYLGLGVAYVILGRNSKAMEACLKAIQLRPGYAKAHYALALSYLMLGDSQSALKEYEILKTLDPDLANQLIDLIDR